MKVSVKRTKVYSLSESYNHMILIPLEVIVLVEKVTNRKVLPNGRKLNKDLKAVLDW